MDNQQDKVIPRTRARFIRRRTKANNYSLPDFQRMIWDLKRVGWSHEKIAYQLDVVPTTVSAWATGGGVFYGHGEQFIDFWREQTLLHRVPRANERHTLKYDIARIAQAFNPDEL